MLQDVMLFILLIENKEQAHLYCAKPVNIAAKRDQKLKITCS